MSDSHVVVTGSSSGMERPLRLDVIGSKSTDSLSVTSEELRGQLEIEVSKLVPLYVGHLSVSEDRALVEVAFREMNIDAWVNNAGVDVLTGEIAWT